VKRQRWLPRSDEFDPGDAHRGVKDKPMPPLQRMEFLENVVAWKCELNPCDNDRYLELKCIAVE